FQHLYGVDIFGRRVFLGMVREALQDFLSGIVGKSKNGRIEMFRQKSGIGKTEELLLLDSIGWDCHDVAAADKNGTCYPSGNGFQEGNGSAGKGNCEHVPTDRHVANTVDLLFV